MTKTTNSAARVNRRAVLTTAVFGWGVGTQFWVNAITDGVAFVSTVKGGFQGHVPVRLLEAL